MRSRSQGKQGNEAEKVILKQETREMSKDEEINETDEEIEEEVEVEEEEVEEEEFEGQEMAPSDDGSDSAPEDISFSQSKQEAVDSLSNALKQMQERRKKIKEKRRKHNDLLNDQKKKKLLKLQEKKLSADFLKQVSETSFQKSTAEESVEESKEKDPDVHHQHFEDERGEMEDEDATLIADRFYVMSRQRAERKPHPISSNAVSFLQQNLYGKHMNRRPVVNVLATEAKLHQRPADNFKVSKAKKKRRGYKRRSLPIS